MHFLIGGIGTIFEEELLLPKLKCKLENRRPFLTISSLFRNEVLRKTIYHGFELQLYEETNVDDQYEYDGEYEDGLENEQLTYLENI